MPTAVIHNRRTSIGKILLGVVVWLSLSGTAWGVVSYLDNGTIKIGIDLSKGGTITSLGTPTGMNIVNSADLGREIQASYYVGPPYTPPGATTNPSYPKWPWNPVQAGDSYGYPSGVLDWYNTGSEIYVKTRPMQWALENVPSNCTMETWYQLNGSVVTVRNRLNNARNDTTQYPCSMVETAVYLTTQLTHLVTYSGAQPFTGAPTTETPGGSFLGTESWAAYVNNSNWGLGLFLPGNNRFGGVFFGTAGGGPTSYSTSYLNSTYAEVLDYNIVYDFTYQLILGNLSDIRSYVYANHPADTRPNYQFNGGRQHWRYDYASDSGFPFGDHLHVLLNNSDPAMHGPESSFQAADVPKLYIRAAFDLDPNTVPIAQLFWASAAGFSEALSYIFLVNNDGQYHTYELDLASKSTWSGLITQLRFDPIPAGSAGDYMDIQYISFVPEPSTLPGDVNGDGFIGGDDLTIILEYWGQSVTGREQGDLNGDFFVAGDDYSEVLTYWGTGTPPPPLTTPMPEPATLMVLLAAGSLLMICRRRKIVKGV